MLVLGRKTNRIQPIAHGFLAMSGNFSASGEEATPRGTVVLAPGTLWEKVQAQTEHALQCGALQTIPTDYEFVEAGGIQFLVRVLSSLARKQAALAEQEASAEEERDPFLPYEADLFVADISTTHICLLNKFNVLDHHLLIVTRAFEPQESLLTPQDFEALGACLAEIDGLAFYNAGQVAGASQDHKHLQLVPLPFVPEGPRLPIAPLLAAVQLQEELGRVPGLPFLHAFTRLAPGWLDTPGPAAAILLDRYRAMLRAVDLADHGPYNLLATRQWMLLVPRAQESFHAIPVNALGFAGSLFVRDAQQMATLKKHGPLAILQHVAVSRDLG